MTPSQIFFYFCLSFIGGIFISSFLFIPHLVWLTFAVLGVLLISTFWFYKKLIVIGFCILFAVLGIWRYQIVENKELKSAIRKYNDTEQTISLIGVIVEEPDIREKSIRLIVKTNSDKILVTTRRNADYRYGDKIKIVGKLKTPPVFEDFNYQNYLKKDGIYSQMIWPEIEVLEQNQGNFVYAKILEFKKKLRQSLHQNLSPPQSSILGAMLLGDKRQLSDDLKNKLNITGVRHITAISGLHVTILSAILMTLLLGFGLGRQLAFWFSIILILFFVIMIGFQPSAVRAGIMGSLFLLAQYWGRQSSSERAIVFAASIMLFNNPLILRLDIGFQLSFLAMLGIIYLLPTFQDWLKFIPKEQIKSVLAMTFSAYVLTLPLVIYNFGYVSLIAPLTNLFIIPLLYPIMFFGFLFVLAGMIFQPLGWIFSWPVWLMLTYLITIVNLFSIIPFAYLPIERIHWVFLPLSYSILAFIIYKLHKRQQLKFLQY
jgi:competence protein ComEC